MGFLAGHPCTWEGCEQNGQIGSKSDVGQLSAGHEYFHGLSPCNRVSVDKVGIAQKNNMHVIFLGVTSCLMRAWPELT